MDVVSGVLGILNYYYVHHCDVINVTQKLTYGFVVYPKVDPNVADIHRFTPLQVDPPSTPKTPTHEKLVLVEVDTWHFTRLRKWLSAEKWLFSLSPVSTRRHFWALTGWWLLRACNTGLKYRDALVVQHACKPGLHSIPYPSIRSHPRSSARPLTTPYSSLEPFHTRTHTYTNRNRLARVHARFSLHKSRAKHHTGSRPFHSIHPSITHLQQPARPYVPAALW